MSEPASSPVIPEANADAAPPEDPPGVTPAFQGL